VLTSALTDMCGQFHAPATLCPGEELPGTHWIGGWASHRAGVDAAARESNPDRPVRSIVTILTGVTRPVWRMSD
jgi:hypothetical protein